MLLVEELILRQVGFKANSSVGEEACSETDETRPTACGVGFHVVILMLVKQRQYGRPIGAV